MKKVIVAGGRDFASFTRLCMILDGHFRETGGVEIVSGGARGVDSMAERWARTRGIFCDVHPADWKKYGKRAGMVRNAEMAEIADELVAIWNGESRGTAAMIDMMKRRGKPVTVYGYDGRRK